MCTSCYHALLYVGPSSLVPDHAVPSSVGHHCDPLLQRLGYVHPADPHANLLQAGPWALNGQCEEENNDSYIYRMQM